MIRMLAIAAVAIQSTLFCSYLKSYAIERSKALDFIEALAFKKHQTLSLSSICDNKVEGQIHRGCQLVIELNHHQSRTDLCTLSQDDWNDLEPHTARYWYLSISCFFPMLGSSEDFSNQMLDWSAYVFL